MSDVMTYPKIVDPSTEGENVAHIVTKEDQMRGYVFGETVTALCGTEFVPSRDYEGRPICGECAHHLHQIRASGGN